MEPTVLKLEPKTRIELRPPTEHRGALFHKRYSVPVWLRWRTFLRRSRAQREFYVQREACRSGLPVVAPAYWDEQRRFGCVVQSEINSFFVRGKTYSDALRAAPSSARRLDLCARAGRLLRELHEGGLLWSTALPRNVIEPADHLRMLACDLPYAVFLGTTILGSGVAELDLFSLGFSPSRRAELSEAERTTFLHAYTAHDGQLAGRLRRALDRRTRGRQRWERMLLRGLSLLPRRVLCAILRATDRLPPRTSRAVAERWS